MGYENTADFELHNQVAMRGQPDYELLVRRTACRGLIMNCANAIRLQASCQAPTTFLTQFLNNHQKWNDFLHQLSVSYSLLVPPHWECC